MKARKAEMRRNILSRRDLVTSREAHEAAERVARAALELARRHLPSGGVAAAYWPIRREIGTRALFAALLEAGIPTALPVMHAPGQALEFKRWTLGDDLEHGPLSLQHPPPSAPTVRPGVVFAPLAAFDAQGGRIGYGAGNYDATLAQLRRGGGVVAVGLAYALQEVEAVPLEPHDQLLDFVITEERTFAMERAA